MRFGNPKILTEVNYTSLKRDIAAVIISNHEN